MHTIWAVSFALFIGWYKLVPPFPIWLESSFNMIEFPYELFYIDPDL
jgi:hypothetical protein